ncbi:N-acetylglucosamine-6-phosphate deacetylase [Corynebacterium heidelbergense]|uniref:N-acetylglucosamine-6-phosphate deacetylase n=1 Tax=Corynebacterium heidelbergense TaxID=2055947 RepID=A0A364V3R2_9CORY|nr:N-acetylglucosamine-6-phosphate deacetylase [Corynebacterium heidelbergense]RAV31269.1 N-acetylglucosamine-6-phosphate deacetylase [Corynebacterium heidelbergense]
MSTADFDPVLVIARRGDVTAVWQVETDPNITRGDFSGAWLLTPEGVSGFAATAEWLPERTDPAAVLRSLVHWPVLLADEVPVADSSDTPANLDATPIPEIPQDLRIDLPATYAAVAEARETARRDFANANPGKRQPAWPEIAEISRVSGHAPKDLEGPALDAVTAVMDVARGLRIWLREWAAFEKVRARRLPDAQGTSPGELAKAPLRWGA